MPTTALRPDVSDVATPDLIRRSNLKLTVEMVRDIDLLYRRLLVRMAAGLLANQSRFFHQTTDLEAADCRAFLLHHAHDAAATSRASAFNEQLVYPATQCPALGVNALGTLPVRIQVGSRYVEYRAD